MLNSPFTATFEYTGNQTAAYDVLTDYASDAIAAAVKSAGSESELRLIIESRDDDETGGFDRYQQIIETAFEAACNAAIADDASAKTWLKKSAYEHVTLSLV